ncbi:Hypothetical predicted protein, partial [Podarcis lilfordi]
MGIVMGMLQDFTRNLAYLLAPHLVHSSALLLVPHSAAALEQLEGKLTATCPAFCLRGLLADLASNEPQRVVHAAWELHGDGPTEWLLLINNARERAAPRRAPERVQSAFLLQ